MKKSIKTYRIYTRWLAFELRKAGFKVINTDINIFHPELTVWIFEDTAAFQKALSLITQIHKM